MKITTREAIPISTTLRHGAHRVQGSRVTSFLRIASPSHFPPVVKERRSLFELSLVTQKASFTFVNWLQEGASSWSSLPSDFTVNQ
jgi:hypothetical protein